MRQDRVFVRQGRRHFRRRYATGEVRAGVGVLAILTLVAVWVGWKGAHPEPGLYEISADVYGKAQQSASRGPLPEDLAPAGWREASLSDFDADNLYVKINGRADYYLTFGFQHLYVLSLVDEQDPGRVVDVEVFDQGMAANALGAYEGERAPGAEAEMGEAGLHHLDRNALFMTHGRHYVRAIASEESEAVRQVLLGLRDRLSGELEGEPLPWAYALFVGGMGLRPAGVSYLPENAFSFGFARNVSVCLLDDDETQVFVVPQSDPAAAAALAARFEEGFLGYGKRAGTGDGVSWIADRYIGTISGVGSMDSWVVGVRGAPDREAAAAALRSLRAGLEALPEDVVARARASIAEASEGSSGDAYEADAYEQEDTSQGVIEG